ncbi:serine/threonine-protein kinase [Streptomyces sp. AM6-12]|uniref:serine/threonine-protein kinase n=1 Tax=Streptomyces sp. AM6-12 TaxID=3345149 RepID=UPI0037BC8962
MSGLGTDGGLRPLDSGDPRTVAGYRLAARLGSGGMGTVYLSYTPGGHPIALKTVRPELSEDAEFRRRFRQEVRAAQRVQGLYTAPVIDYDTEGARPWLATAYVAGPALASAVAEHGPLPLPSILLLLAGTAEALSVIHGAGIVHRDLKPSNVLLAADGPRVIDFGIARAADATALTGTGIAVGTPAFMSPEQAAGRPVTPASDVFALGQTAVFAARGQGAYGDGPSHAVLYRIVHEEPDLAGLPAELAFVARCLAKDPAARPTPAEVVALCQEASPAPLRQSGSWLPKALTAQITQRASASAALAAAPTAAPATVPPTAPVTRLDAPAPAPVPPGPAQGTPVHAAPTATAGPAVPLPAQPPHGPLYQHPAPPRPYPPYVQPYAWQPPKPKRSVGRKIAVGAAITVALLWGAGCVSVLSHLGDTSDDGSSRTSSSASGKHRPDPKPVSFKGINIPKGYWVRFADSPPKPVDEQNTSNASFGKDADFYYDDDPYYSDDQTPVVGTAGDKVVLLDNAEHGSLATCRKVTRYADNIHLSQLSAGSQICVHTVSGHIGLVTYRGRAGRDSPSDYITVDLTVWRNAEPASGDEG